ncbi:MAG: MBOAT family O-acyltransferase, partial [Acidobacteriota bacterium]
YSIDLLLSSPTYFVFLVAIFALYWPLARWRALALAWILFANYFFYARWDMTYLILIPAASSCDFFIGLGLQNATRPWIRRMLVSLSILVNLGLLAFYKYMPFFLANWASWTGREAPAWKWILPITLSFYVFQSLTYTIDLYRRDAKGTRSYLAHLAAVSFFPTTLAGPITRVSSLIDQMEKRKPLEAADGGRAMFLIGMGLMKKLMIADYLAENLINRVFDFPNLYSGTESLVAVYSYAFQIYYDFSGYTDIAIGSALLLGIKLPANFNRPYAAVNLTEFWRCWHITLSNWLRDYLYFSLPGLRSKWKVFAYSNLVLTMVIGGLWHGASWTFVMWGALHGLGLVAVRLWQGIVPHRKKDEGLAVWRILSIVLTFHFVAYAWIFFRSGDMATAWTIIERIRSGTVSFVNVQRSYWVVLAVGVVGHYLPRRWYAGSLDLYMRAPFYAQAAALAALVFSLRYVVTTGAAPFIYNQF